MKCSWSRRYPGERDRVAFAVGQSKSPSSQTARSLFTKLPASRLSAKRWESLYSSFWDGFSSNSPFGHLVQVAFVHLLVTNLETTTGCAHRVGKHARFQHFFGLCRGLPHLQ